MSSEFAIEVTNLGKCYQIYDKPSDRLKQMLFRGRRKYYKEFWALKDVSFKVNKGETVGVIGRNGSGKSTLLQMICGTLNPTEGDVKVNGRVAALLELGAGFNPEFTGVENVYMAASLYGITKEEVDRRFEAIAAFADIGEHIHQPVKTYSSGMYVRLAFAVIAHVDADILVIDEALAVGDAVFTQKCMRFIRNFRENGTLLFVSHDIGSVLNLCESVIWLSEGNICMIGKAKDTSEAYLNYTFREVYNYDTQLSLINALGHTAEDSLDAKKTETPSAINYNAFVEVKDFLSEANNWMSGTGEITSVKLESASQKESGSRVLKGGELVRIIIHAIAYRDIPNPILGFLVRDKLGQDLFGENTLSYTKCNPFSVLAGEAMQTEFIFKLPMLPNGDYSVMASLADGDLKSNIQHHWLHEAIIFHVSSSKVRYGLVGIEFKNIVFSKK